MQDNCEPTPEPVEITVTAENAETTEEAVKTFKPSDAANSVVITAAEEAVEATHIEESTVAEEVPVTEEVAAVAANKDILTEKFECDQ